MELKYTCDGFNSGRFDVIFRIRLILVTIFFSAHGTTYPKLNITSTRIESVTFQVYFNSILSRNHEKIIKSIKKIQNLIKSNIYKLRNRIQLAKNNIFALDKSDIYQIPWGYRWWNYSYIGHSRSAIKNRFVEHLRAYQNNHPDALAIAYHMFFDGNDQKHCYQHEFEFSNLKLILLVSIQRKQTSEHDDLNHNFLIFWIMIKATIFLNVVH
jgi:hypothetical protein